MIALLYVIGFVVANVHFGAYEVVRPDLLRMRYLSAAILFVVVTAIPFGTALWTDSLYRWKGWDGKRSLPSRLFLPAMGTLAGFGIWTLVSGAIGVPSFRLSSTLFFLTCVVVGLAVRALGRESTRADSNVLPEVRASLGALLVIGFTWIPIAFSLTVYAYTHPQFGGGGVWFGTVDIEGEIIPVNNSNDRLSAGPTVGFVGGGSADLGFIVCVRDAGTGRSAALPTSVSLARVRATSLRGITTLRTYAHLAEQVGCARLDSALLSETHEWLMVRPPMPARGLKFPSVAP